MKEQIKEAMVNYCKNCSADRYGQMGTIDVYSVFKDTTEEALKFIREHNLIRVGTYGWRYGTYQAIGSIHDIMDDDILSACKEAWAQNQNRIRNLNQW